MNLTSQVKECIINMLNNFKSYDYCSENYELVTGTPIGEGGFGKVYKVVKRESETNEVLAMKEIKICFEENYNDESVSLTSGSDEDNILDFVQCCQEAVLQSEVFKHPHIVAVHDKWIQQSKDLVGESTTYADDILTIVEFLQSGGEKKGVNVLEITPEVRQALINTEGLCFYLTMDLYDTNLMTWLATNEKASEIKEEILRQVADALSYIHYEKGYCHLDLTPSNILIRDKGGIHAAIADFGLSQLYEASIPHTSEARPGKAPYNQAPDEHLTDKFDMWSFGLIVYETLNLGETTTSEIAKLSEYAKVGDPSLIEFITHNLTDDSLLRLRPIILDCLKQTTDRITARELFGEYFDDLDLSLKDESDKSVYSEDTISYISTGSANSLRLRNKTARISIRRLSSSSLHSQLSVSPVNDDLAGSMSKDRHMHRPISCILEVAALSDYHSYEAYVNRSYSTDELLTQKLLTGEAKTILNQPADKLQQPIEPTADRKPKKALRRLWRTIIRRVIHSKHTFTINTPL